MSDNERGQSTIMVVDDQPQNLRLFEKMLISAGYTRLVMVEESREVFGLVKSAEPDLVILDLNMPHLNGHEVMAQIQTLPSPPAVIIVTAQMDRENRLRALKSGARDLLTKPVEMTETLSRIENVLGAHLYQKEVKRRSEILEERVRERTLELADSRLDIIRRLGRAAEWRDNETGLHIIRMSKMSQILGLKAGINQVQAEQLLNASGMHDIGKIGIPDAVLLKPGKLDAAEWEIMKTHAQMGADLLDGSSSELMIMARDIAKTHHEKWDGSGYPNGLAGEDIPLVGRIVAVADVFDALTSVRPYKRAWSMEEALDFLRENAGRHFDPVLVSLFIDAFDEIKPICESFSDAASDS
jgi:putative two-component system response regulator